MKKPIIIVILSILGLSVLGVLVKQKHEDNDMLNSELPQKVGDAIEGTYTVFVSPEYHGELNIQSGSYSFSPLSPNSLEQNVEIFFINYPVGTYEIKRYYGLVTQSTILENLNEDEILLQIDFHSNSGTQSSYLIRNDKENRELYFHSLVNELELWQIRKSWD